MPNDRQRLLHCARVSRSLALESLETRDMLSADPRLIDVNDIVSGGSGATNYLQVGDTLYFSASDGFTGPELWKSDGTAAGTTLVKDIRPGTSGSTPANLVDLNGTLFFTINDGSEIWRSDGTDAGTWQVVDLAQSLIGPAPLQVFGDYLFFTDRAIGTTLPTLWRTDGTPEGTTAFRSDLSCRGLTLALAGDEFYFSGFPDGLGGQLWKSDGTEAGTQLVKDFGAGREFTLLTTNAVVDGILYFDAVQEGTDSELWRTDGTEAGTYRVKDIRPGPNGSNISGLTNVAGTIYFSANNGVGKELWKSDGTEAGTVLVKDIRPTTTVSSSPAKLTAVGNRLFFTADDGVTGQELWTSDGTAEGTIRLGEIRPGTSPSEPSSFTEFQGDLYFTAIDGSITGIELWRSDGTVAGTELVRDFNPSTNLGVLPGSLARFRDKLVLTANDGVIGAEPWISDGTDEGAMLIADIGRSTPPANPQYMTAVGTDVYFVTALNGSYILWKTDGTQAGTHQVKTLGPVLNSNAPSEFADVNGKLYFVADDGVHGKEVWVSDGTADGTHMVADAFPGADGSNPFQITAFNGFVWFYARNASFVYQLWRSDGSAAGTAEYAPTQAPSTIPESGTLLVVGDTLYFAADTTGAGNELWKTDGTTTALRVKDIRPGAEGSHPLQLTNLNGTLYFTSDDGVHGRELWRSDGTEAGTGLVADIAPGGQASEIVSLIAMGDRLYFSAYAGLEAGVGQELWISDGTTAGTHIVVDLRPGFNSSNPVELTVVGNAFYFLARQPSPAIHLLHKSDGTAAGTTVVTMSDGTIVSELTAFNGQLFFTMGRDGHGEELWRTDGTVLGTVLVADLNAGPGNSNPQELIVAGGALYFRATDVLHGEELWVIDPLSPPGDFDGDRLVTGGDFLLWQRQLGATGPGLSADANRDGIVNEADLAPWRESASSIVRAIAAPVMAAPKDEAEKAPTASPALTSTAAADLALAQFEFARPASRPRAAASRGVASSAAAARIMRAAPMMPARGFAHTPESSASPSSLADRSPMATVPSRSLR
jgi:ELWxxDGT repeat protein